MPTIAYTATGRRHDGVVDLRVEFANGDTLTRTVTAAKIDTPAKLAAWLLDQQPDSQGEATELRRAFSVTYHLTPERQPIIDAVTTAEPVDDAAWALLAGSQLGTITLAAWALITRVQIRIVHIVGAALAVGGFGVLRSAVSGKPSPNAQAGTQGAGGGATPPNSPTGSTKPASASAGILQRIGAAIAREYKYFEKFVKQVLGAVNAAARAGMYAEAGRGTYEEARAEAMKASGKTEERRLLGIADHCSDCVAEANKGWQPIGTLRAIGDSLCKSNCHCRKEFR